MATSRPRVDVSDVEEIQLRSISFSMKNPRIKPGYQVFVKGNFRADFHTGDAKDVNSPRAWTEIQMTPNADNVYESVVPDLEVGQMYEYVYRVVPNDGTPEFYIKDGTNNRTKKIEGEDNRAKRGKEDALRKDVKAEVAQVLTSAKDAKSADRIGTLTEELEILIRQRHGVKENITNLVLAVLAEIIREDKNLPTEIRAQFPAESPLSNFSDLTARLDKGAKLFRETVFLKLMGDPAAQKFFKLNARARYNDSDPLGNPKWSESFKQHCDSRCLTAGSAYFEKHLKAVAEKEVVDPLLRAERMDDADIIISRLPKAEQSHVKEMLKEVPTGRKSEVIDWITHIWGVASLTGFDGYLGVAVSATKSLVEGASGISSREIMASVDKGDAKPVIDALRRNNILWKWVKEKGGLWNRTKETLFRMSPIWGGKRYAGKSVSGFEAKGMEEVGVDSTTISPDKLISDACDSAINPSK